jgi:hypothetical protein
LRAVICSSVVQLGHRHHGTRRPVVAKTFGIDTVELRPVGHADDVSGALDHRVEPAAGRREYCLAMAEGGAHLPFEVIRAVGGDAGTGQHAGHEHEAVGVHRLGIMAARRRHVGSRNEVHGLFVFR